MTILLKRNLAHRRTVRIETLERRDALTTASLVADINAIPTPSQHWNLEPSYLRRIGDFTYFFQENLAESQAFPVPLGHELWRTNGEQTELVHEMPHGVSSYGSVYVDGTSLYFETTDDLLWSFDTVSGKALNLGSIPQQWEIAQLVSTDSFLIAVGRTRDHRFELLSRPLPDEPSSNIPLRQITSGLSTSFYSVNNRVVATDDWVYFPTRTEDGTHELWRTNGSPEGTNRVMANDSSLEIVEILGVYRGDLLISVPTATGDLDYQTLSESGIFTSLDLSDELIATIGDEIYTRRGNQVWKTSGAEQRLFWESELAFAYGGNARQVGGELIRLQFRSLTDPSVAESILSDGSVQVVFKEAGETTEVTTRLATGAEGSEHPIVFVHGENEAFESIWSTNGTDSVNEIFRRHEPATQSSRPDLLGVVDNQLLFQLHSQMPATFWSLAAEPEQLLKSVVPATWFTPVEGGAFFRSTYGDSARQLWYFAGNETRPVADFSGHTLPDGTQGSEHKFYVRSLTQVDDHVYFLVNEAELWRVNNSDQQVSFLTRQFDEIERMTQHGDHLYFVADKGLWRTNASGDGVELVRRFSSAPRQLASNGDVLFFTVLGETDAVWKTNGSAIGTEIVSVLPDKVRSNRAGKVVNGRYVLFLGSGQEGQSYSLWSTDGTATNSGTIIVFATPFPPTNFAVNGIGSHAVFSTEDQGGHQLWLTDTTPTGTQPITTLDSLWLALVAGERDFYVSSTNENDRFVDSSSIGRITLESSSFEWLDDSRRFTVASRSFPEMMEHEGNLYFVAEDRRHGEELWRIDLSPIQGDANGDNQVNFADFLLLASSFGKSRDVAFADGDFNFDGVVDFRDFLLLAQNFHGQ